MDDLPIYIFRLISEYLSDAALLKLLNVCKKFQKYKSICVLKEQYYSYENFCKLHDAGYKVCKLLILQSHILKKITKKLNNIDLLKIDKIKRFYRIYDNSLSTVIIYYM